MSYEQAVALNPRDFRVLYNRGNILVELERFEAALASYDQALSEYPRFADAHNNRGNVLQKLKRHAEAISSFDEAIRIEPRNAEPYNGRGVSLLAQHKFQEALLSFDQAIAARSDYAQAYINRGNALQELHQLKSAVESYDISIALNATFVEAFAGRGTALLTAKQFGAAIDSFERGLRLDKESPNLLGLCAYAKLQICDWRSLSMDARTVQDGLAMGKALAPPFPVLALLDSPASQMRAAKILIDREFPGEAVDAPIAMRSESQRIRVGYFSADFRGIASRSAASCKMHSRRI